MTKHRLMEVANPGSPDRVTHTVRVTTPDDFYGLTAAYRVRLQWLGSQFGLVRTSYVSAIDHLTVSVVGSAGTNLLEPADAVKHAHR
jgi:hypothetical protein